MIRCLKELVGTPELERLRASYSRRTKEGVERSAAIYKGMQQSVARLKAAGVYIGFGSDAGAVQDHFHAFTDHRELQLMVEAGLTPMEAIVAATRNSATILRQMRRGVIEQDMVADFVVLDANPLDSIANTKRIADVYLRGAVVDRAALAQGMGRTTWRAAMTSASAMAATVALALGSAGGLHAGLRGAGLRAPSTGTVDSHVAAAKAAAGQDHAALFDTLCSATALRPPAPAPPAAAGAARGAAPAGPRPAPPRSEWYAEPVKVFDNLYFVGQTEYSVWAVTTSAGIIVIDAIFDYSVEAEVAEGLKKLGLDPTTIRYAIISHGHGDHHGGAKFLQEKYGARIIMGAPDWDLVERGAARTPAPKRDIVATDGQKLTLGDTTLTLYLTPGTYAGDDLDAGAGQGRRPLASRGGVGWHGLQLPEDTPTTSGSTSTPPTASATSSPRPAPT